MPAYVVATQHSVQDIIDLTESVCRSRVRSINSDTVGGSNAVYFVSLANGLERVVRVSPAEWHESVAIQVWAMRACADRGVPVPDVLAYDTSRVAFPEPYLIMPRLPGATAAGITWTPTQRRAILEQLGVHLRTIHGVALSGFGPLIFDNAAPIGTAVSQHQYALSQFEDRISALPKRAIDPSRVNDLRQLLMHHRAAFEISGASLIHGDYQLKNVLVAGDTVTGILDFENAVAGDPAWDFWALFARSAEPERDLVALRRGYGATSSDTPSFFQRLFLYGILGSLELLWWHYRLHDAVGIAGIAAQLQRLESALNRLG